MQLTKKYGPQVRAYQRPKQDFWLLSLKMSILLGFYCELGEETPPPPQPPLHAPPPLHLLPQLQLHLPPPPPPPLPFSAW